MIMKKFFYLGVCFFLTAYFFSLQAQGLKGFKLQNGLTVYVWEDETKPDVFGMVGVKVGSVDDPEDLTGLAHYLEHMMFKGTQKISALDWEKEQPLYEQIIAKYDEKANTQDPEKKKSLDLEINKLTVEAAQYTAPNEFAGLTENMGGKSLNAATSYDMTMYFSSFPPSQLYRWLELNSERFINPVFRAFQPELETVYEEFNRSQDSHGRLQQEYLLEHIFPGHPYSRSVLGLQDHLKNPRLSGLVKFYNDWYVPENMVLILVGNVKMREVTGLVNNLFGRLPAKPSPERVNYPEADFKGRVEYSAKIADYPTLTLAYKGVPSGSEDELALEVCTNLLSNRNRTGLLDKLSLDGNIMGASASLLDFKDQGRIVIYGIPSYDVNQRRFESLKSLEKTLLAEIEKMQKGEIEDWRFNSVKTAMMRDYDLAFESSESKAQMILQTFVNNEDISNVLTYKDRLAAISLDKVKEIAKKYFTDNYIAFKAAVACIEKELVRELAGCGAYAEVSDKLEIFPSERMSLYVNCHPCMASGLPGSVSPGDPLSILEAVRKVTARLGVLEISETDLKAYKEVLVSEFEYSRTDPESVMLSVLVRYSEGKDLVTNFSRAVDELTADDIKKVLALLQRGAEVEYVII